MAVSTASPGFIWVHNDSGDEPRFYAVDRAGSTVHTVEAGGASAVDWEDMALVGGRLYAGDIGDNRERRDGVQIYRIDEPALGDGSPRSRVAAQRMTLRYPDGAHDAETLLVHPGTGEIGLVTKDAENAALYVTSGFLAGETVTLERAATVPLSLATAGDVSSDGRAIVLRDYTSGYLFDLDGPALASAFDEPPLTFDLPFAGQSEAVAFEPGGSRVLTTSEGAGSPVFAVDVPTAPEPGSPSPTSPPGGEVEPPADDQPGAPPAAAFVAVAALIVGALAFLRRRAPQEKESSATTGQ